MSLYEIESIEFKESNLSPLQIRERTRVIQEVMDQVENFNMTDLEDDLWLTEVIRAVSDLVCTDDEGDHEYITNLKRVWKGRE